MNLTAVILTMAGIIIVIAITAWLFSKFQLKFKELKLKGGPVEATFDRERDKNSKIEPERPKTKAAQIAKDGGRIKNATIEAPAESGAKAKQEAEGDGSAISDSNIKLS